MVWHGLLSLFHNRQHCFRISFCYHVQCIIKANTKHDLTSFMDVPFTFIKEELLRSYATALVLSMSE